MSGLFLLLIKVGLVNRYWRTQSPDQLMCALNIILGVNECAMRVLFFSYGDEGRA